jgi:hypothetical protein
MMADAPTTPRTSPPTSVSCATRRNAPSGRGSCPAARCGLPAFKLLVNRLANLLVRLLFGIGYNDTTNAFKGYRREVIDGCAPLISPHFNLTVEIR